MRCHATRVRRTAPFRKIIMQVAGYGCTSTRAAPGEPRPRRATRPAISSTCTCRCSSTPGSSSARSARAWTAASPPRRGTRTTSRVPPTSAASTACGPSSTPSSSAPAPWPRTTPASPCGRWKARTPSASSSIPTGASAATGRCSATARRAPWSFAAPRREAPAAGRQPDLLELPADPASADGGLAPSAIVAGLRAQGLARILVEGGGVTVSRFLGAGVLDPPARRRRAAADRIGPPRPHPAARPVPRPRPAAPVPAVPARRRPAVRPRSALTRGFPASNPAAGGSPCGSTPLGRRSGRRDGPGRARVEGRRPGTGRRACCRPAASKTRSP